MTPSEDIDQLLPVLNTAALFKDFSPQEMRAVLLNLPLSVHHYPPQSFIAFEEDECTRLGIVIHGSVRVERLFPSGKTVTLDTLGPGASFGEAIIFANHNRYPATIQSLDETGIFYLSAAHVIHLCKSSERFLVNFSRLLSNRLLMLNSRVKSLSYTTIRQRVVNYLLDEYRRQKSPHLALPLSRRELANILGIPRPSLSRELARLQSDGLIHFERHAVDLLSLDALEKTLFQ